MIVIRKARPDEVKTLQDLNDEVFIDNQKYDLDLKMDWAQGEPGREYFTKLLNSEESFAFIAEDDGKPVGYIACGPRDFSYRLSKYVEIENMGVIPEYRSKGIGSQLIEKVLEEAKSRGFQKMYVNSYFHNTEAVSFYKKSGFSEIATELERSI